MDEVSITESEVQVDRSQMAVIASILFGLIIVVAAVMMWNKRSLKDQAVEVLPVDQDS